MAKEQQGVELGRILDERSAITFYGHLLDDMSMESPPRSMQWPKDGPFPFAALLGAQLGNGYCIGFGKPVLMLVPSDGTELTEEECGFSAPIRKWALPADLPTVAMMPKQLTCLDAVQYVDRERGISAGLEFKNVGIQGNKVCADVRVWIKIDIDELFIHIHESYDQTHHICIALINTWITLWSFDIGIVKVAIEATYRPNLLCGRIHISIPFGIYDGYLPNQNGECVFVPFREGDTDNQPIVTSESCCKS